MYVPDAFRVSDPDTLHGFIAAYGFATLVTPTEEGPVATHVPLLLQRTSDLRVVLVGHMARANPHWQRFDAAPPSLAIFHGPHAYISPSWYVSRPAVPTWNYAAVHAVGRPVLVEDPERVARMLAELVSFYESGRAEPWSGELPPDFRARMQRGIAAFEMPVDRLEGKFKLGQNRPEADQESALAGLAAERGSDPLIEFWRDALRRK